MKKWNFATALNHDTQKLMDRINRPRACFCVGPQNGEPLCPCRMRGVTVRNGRYVGIIDYGPVPKRVM
jgi:hypothetical protein